VTRWPGGSMRPWLAALDPDAAPAEQFRMLVADRAITLPFPASGRTLQRWQVLSDVASHDLSLVKLYEGHTDALAILHELHDPAPIEPGSTWGVWAAESPGARVTLAPARDGRMRLNGVKQWCSGARSVTHALLTAWSAEGRGPYLVKLVLGQPGVSISAAAWQAVGMADSDSLDVRFDDVVGETVGAPGDYVARPGFMQGGAGIAACWFGGAVALASTLHRAVAGAADARRRGYRSAALGKVDTALSQTAALLRETAAWIDRSPQSDATIPALRARQSADACARVVLDEVGRALGATPFCRDRRFARMAADLTVYTRQSLAERDFESLGERVAARAAPSWQLQA
jgi:alkylation response protein AidB-like acyl-CoA dehydrogenase